MSAERYESPHGQLRAIAESVLAQVTEHPFWAGLRTGTLPPAALWYFAEQDAHHLVPTYARALARCAAAADRDHHAALLCSAGQATFGSLSRLDSELTKLAMTFAKTVATTVTATRTGSAARCAPGPAAHAYTSFMLAAPARSFPAGVGGLLPMTWFHLLVSNDLMRRRDPRTRYAAWIDQYRAYDGFDEYVGTYLRLIDDVAEWCSVDEWNELVEQFSIGARYELAFADAAWRCQDWPMSTPIVRHQSVTTG